MLSRKDPSNKTSHLVEIDLVTKEHIPVFPVAIVFLGIKKILPFFCVDLHKDRMLQVQLRGICTNRIHLVNKGL